MPNWTPLDLDYRAYCAGSEPFARSREGFPAAGLAKRAAAPNSRRQSYFEAELLRISDAVGSDAIPVFLSFRGERRRMDRGCVGHAVARGILEPPVDGPGGVVDAVVLTRRSVAGGGGG